MNSFPVHLRLRPEYRRRAGVSLLAGEALTLSALHHYLNFWALPLGKILLGALVVGPAVAVLIFFALGPIWQAALSVRAGRWLAFLIPGAIIAAALAWHYYAAPESQHFLEVDPSITEDGGEVQITEIRAAYGNIVPLSEFADLPGWSLRAGVLRVGDPSAETIRVTFWGPASEQVRVRFITTPHGGYAAVSVDGTRLVYDLRGPDGNVTNARMPTQFRWGSLNYLVRPILSLIDWVAMLSVLAGIWLAHETGQIAEGASLAKGGDSIGPHTIALGVVVTVGILAHAFSFLSVPLVLTKDSPSYLDGAVHWLAYHNLDGVPPYRGPGTTFLFAPAMAFFGRNPWGIKWGLHLVGLACVPLAYWLGWQLGYKRWIALVAGLMTALTPDLHFYSSIVMTEILQVFALLTFCALIVMALRTESARWVFAASLAGSLAVLIRAENIVILLVWLTLVGVRGLWSMIETLPGPEKDARIKHRAGTALPQFLCAVAIAAVPLLAWAAHNQRVNGFFGISDAGPGALYDGWIYFGENSKINIVDPESDAVQAINASIPIAANRSLAAPTVWTVHSALVGDGYSIDDALALLGRATTDSIRANPALAWRLLLVKLRQAFQPYAALPDAAPAARGGTRDRTAQSGYFDRESALPDDLVYLRLLAYGVIGRWYSSFYRVWLWLSVLMIWLGAYRRPWVIWLAITAIVSASILIPNIVGMSMWRYVIPGLVVMQPIALLGLATMARFATDYVGQVRLALSRAR